MSRTGALGILFAALVIASGSYIFVSSESLPNLVASHFAVDGTANGFVPRTDYVWLMLTLAIAVPAGVVILIGLIPRVAPRLSGIPNRAHWLASAERVRTMRFLWQLALFVGCLLVLFAAAVHYLIVRANLAVPPMLDNGLLFALIGVLIAALAVTLAVFVRRFSRPRD
jgi:uncharacterized membrane protein